MQGVITSYSKTRGTGRIKGRTGRLYSFGLFEWDSPQVPPAPDMTVVFSRKPGKTPMACNIRPAQKRRQAH